MTNTRKKVKFINTNNQLLMSILQKDIAPEDQPEIIRQLVMVVLSISDGNIEMSDRLTDLDKAMRGDGANPGVINKLDAILSEIKARQKADEKAESSKPTVAPPPPELFREFVKWIGDRVMPSIVTALVLWFLLTFIPQAFRTPTP